MKTRGGWRESPQTHEIAVREVDDMTDDELIAMVLETGAELGWAIDMNARPKVPARPARYIPPGRS